MEDPLGLVAPGCMIAVDRERWWVCMSAAWHDMLVEPSTGPDACRLHAGLLLRSKAGPADSETVRFLPGAESLVVSMVRLAIMAKECGFAPGQMAKHVKKLAGLGWIRIVPPFRRGKSCFVLGELVRGEDRSMAEVLYADRWARGLYSWLLARRREDAEILHAYWKERGGPGPCSWLAETPCAWRQRKVREYLSRSPEGA